MYIIVIKVKGEKYNHKHLYYVFYLSDKMMKNVKMTLENAWKVVEHYRENVWEPW